MSDIKAGDVVRLKSGGPEMTVSVTSEKGGASVVWFGEDLSLICESVLPLETLEKINE